MNDVDNYISQIEQLKKVLEFYSNEYNWNSGIIEKDKGFMAKKTLESISNINNTMKQYKELYDQIVQTNKEEEIAKILKQHNLI